MSTGKTSRRITIGVSLVVLMALLSGCSGNSDWGWYVVSPMTKQGQNNLSFMLLGLKFTLLMSFTALCFSMVAGLIIALPGLSRYRFPRRVNFWFVEVVRAIPLLPLILWVYYGMPQLTGVQLELFWAGVIALAVSDSAFEAEIFRAGIQSVPRGQTEASRTVGLTYFKTMRYVVLPQAIRQVLPPLGNQFAYMIKMSSLVSIIGYPELTRKANELIVTEYRALEIYSVLILEYIVIIMIVGQGVRWLERRMEIGDRPQMQPSVKQVN